MKLKLVVDGGFILLGCDEKMLLESSGFGCGGTKAVEEMGNLGLFGSCQILCWLGTMSIQTIFLF